jgi:hypothetical protein
MLLWSISGICATRLASEFASTWVFNYHGKPIFMLVLSVEHGRLIGSVTKPKDLIIDSDGDVTATGPDQVTRSVQSAKLTKERLEFTIDGDGFVMTLKGSNQASLVTPGVRPMLLDRVADGKTVVLATSLPAPDYPEDIRALQEHLRDMVKEDQDARLAFDQARIEAVDAKNRSEVRAIFGRYGWVTNSLAGKEAGHNFWLLVQHQTTEIQRQLLPALEKAAKSRNASMSDYAYLYDRVEMGLDKPQRWGTQVVCKNGKPVLYRVEDPAGLDARRKELLMMPVREYLKLDYLVNSCEQAGK